MKKCPNIGCGTMFFRSACNYCKGTGEVPDDFDSAKFVEEFYRALRQVKKEL